MKKTVGGSFEDSVTYIAMNLKMNNNGFSKFRKLNIKATKAVNYTGYLKNYDYQEQLSISNLENHDLLY